MTRITVYFDDPHTEYIRQHVITIGDRKVPLLPENVPTLVSEIIKRGLVIWSMNAGGGWQGEYILPHRLRGIEFSDIHGREAWPTQTTPKT